MKKDPIIRRNLAASSIFVQTQVHEDSTYRPLLSDGLAPHFCQHTCHLLTTFDTPFITSTEIEKVRTVENASFMNYIRCDISRWNNISS